MLEATLIIFLKKLSQKLVLMALGLDNKAYEISPPPVILLAQKCLPDTPEIIKPSVVKPQQNEPSDSDALPIRQWDTQWEFIMSCVSMSVGLGNVWRFPVTAYENGGGAFLIPYIIVAFIIGRPVYFMELVLGQFTSYSQAKAWKCTPIFKGVGYMSMVATSSICSYYVSIMAITVFYFVQSFKSTLPWASCEESWAGAGNCNGSATSSNYTTPEMYFIRVAIKEAANLDNGIGPPGWELVACLATCWVIIFACLSRGVKSSGKVAYFTAIFPYVVLIILLCRGLTLPGAWTGVKYLIQPNWSKLLEPKVWFAAVSQNLFSLSAGFGPIIMLGSYNPFRHNIYRDSLIISIVDTCTSLLAGITIFAVLGNLAQETGVDVAHVVQGGTGLVFSSYPDAIAKFGWCPQLFAVLFFSMLFTLGVGTIVGDIGAVATQICDKFPRFVRWQVTLVICLLQCCVGIMYTTPGGQFLVTLVDFFGGSFIIYCIALLEIIGVVWIYGVENFIDDVEFMLNVRLGWYWKICWGVLNPIFLTAVLFYSLAQNLAPIHNGMEYPLPYLISGWLLACVAIFSFPFGGIHSMSKIPGSLTQKFWTACRPNSGWGPRQAKHRSDWIEFKKSRSHLSIFEKLKRKLF